MMALEILAYQRDAHLLAEMLARVPADFRLPPDCAKLFDLRPISASRICTTYKSEFTVLEAFVHDIDPVKHSDTRERTLWVERWLYDQHATDAFLAQEWAKICSPAFTHLLEHDRIQELVGRGNRPFRELGFACLGNPVGCAHRDFASPRGWIDEDLSHFGNQRARARLLQLLLHARERRARDASFRLTPETLRALSTQFGLTRRELALERGGGRIGIAIDQPLPNGEKRWSIPLPEALQPGPTRGR